MRRHIQVDQLRMGMYIQELGGSWMEHPFWNTTFLIDDPKDLHRIIDSGIKEVWIDTAKGIDVEPGQADSGIRGMREEDLVDQIPQSRDGTPGEALDDEMRVARKIVFRSRDAVASMFQEARMGAAIPLDRAEKIIDEIGASVFRNSDALVNIARLKQADDYTYMHSVSVCALMTSLAKQLGLDSRQTHAAGLGGLLHDVGKMAIPIEVLNKPGKLSDAEFALMKTHPIEGHQMLSRGGAIAETVLDICLHHHEKTEGSGYPARLADKDISLFAKMGAVCDVYDAITSDRPYKKGWDPAVAVRNMAEWSTGHFDARIFRAFVKCVGIYPIGALVRLKSGRLAVVVEQSDKSLLAPKVTVIYSTKSQVRVRPETIDLSHRRVSDRILAHEDPAKWNFGDLSGLWNI